MRGRDRRDGVDPARVRLGPADPRARRPCGRRGGVAAVGAGRRIAASHRGRGLAGGGRRDGDERRSGAPCRRDLSARPTGCEACEPERARRRRRRPRSSATCASRSCRRPGTRAATSRSSRTSTASATLFSGDALFPAGRILLQDTWDCDLHDALRSVERLAALAAGATAGRAPRTGPRGRQRAPRRPRWTGSRACCRPSPWCERPGRRPRPGSGARRRGGGGRRRAHRGRARRPPAPADPGPARDAAGPTAGRASCRSGSSGTGGRLGHRPGARLVRRRRAADPRVCISVVADDDPDRRAQLFCRAEIVGSGRATRRASRWPWPAGWRSATRARAGSHISSDPRVAARPAPLSTPSASWRGRRQNGIPAT